MLKGLFFLLLFQFAGELIVRVFGLPLSGPICGMALLLVWLSLSHRSISTSLGSAADSILANMPILFVPVGVGVMAYWEQLGQNIGVIGVTLIVSTLIGLGVTAFTFHTARNWRGSLQRRRQRRALSEPVEYQD